jgi:hypothetical protein
MRAWLIFAVIVALAALFSLGKAIRNPHVPAANSAVVPNETTAIQSALAALVPIYGQENIERQKPFRASLSGDVWIVEGSLAPEYVGGVAVVKISKIDGRIVSVAHGK